MVLLVEAIRRSMAANIRGGGAGAQLGFAAKFTGAQFTVPEPSEFLLLATGLSTMAGTLRFRRRRREAA